MSNISNAPVLVSASYVRDWAVRTGLRSADAKVIGKLTDAEVAAFNSRHKAKAYKPGQAPTPTTAVKVGRKVVHVESATLRAAIGAGKRGKVNASKAAEYVIGAGLV
jgi:hypothetical protein